MHRLPLYLFLLVVAAIVSGCGGHSSYQVQTDGTGDLRGLRADPADGDTNVRIDPTICVYWVTGYEPPSEFKFVLRDQDDAKVLTIQKSSDDPNTWLFAPLVDLDYSTRYSIQVEYQDVSRTFTFWTEEDDELSMLSVRQTKPPGPGDSSAKYEHVVRTRR